MLVLELFSILLEHLVPLLLFRCPFCSVLVVHIVDVLRHDERLVRVKAKCLLYLRAVVRLEWISVHTTSAFEFRAETDCGRQLDNGWLVFNFLSLRNGCFNAFQIMVAILYPLCVKSISFEPFQDILGEGTLGVTICSPFISFARLSDGLLFKHTNGDVVIIVDHNQVAQLKVTSCTSSFTGNAFHSAAITEKAVSVVID